MPVDAMQLAQWGVRAFHRPANGSKVGFSIARRAICRHFRLHFRGVDRNQHGFVMTAWPGGNCPECGEYAPAKIIHCRNCRALLNPDLDPDSVEIPEFVPLREISAMVEVEARGYFISCPDCDRELRINRKYLGKRVSCKHCSAQFPLNFTNGSVKRRAVYTTCPHCEKELRAADKYLGEKVACKHCKGEIQLVDQAG